MTHWSGFDAAADRRLLKRLAEGTEPALADVYDIYAERLYDYAAHFTDDVHLMRELVHDVLIDAARRAPRLRDRRRLRPWLYGAVRRRAMTRRRDGWAPPSTRDMSRPPETQGTATADLRAAGAALEALERGLRDVLWLAYRHGVEDADLAAALGVSPHRARRRLARATARVEEEAVRRFNCANVEAPAAIELVRMLPAPTPPEGLRDRVLHTAADAQLARYRSQIVARGGRLVAGGLPRQPDAPSQVARRYAVGSASVAAFLGIMTVGANLVGTDRGPGTGPAPWTAEPGGGSPLPTAHGRPPNGTPPQTRPTATRGDDGGQRDGMKLRPTPRPSSGSPQPSSARPSSPAAPPGLSSPSVPPVRRPGTLTVRPASIHFGGSSSTATLTLTAKSGPVTWTATAVSPALSLSPAAGRLAAGGAQRVTVRLSRNALLQLAGDSTIAVAGGGVHTVPVSWSASVLSSG